MSKMDFEGLRPSEDIMAAAFALTAVYMIFQMNVPNGADIRASAPGNPIVHSSVKSATLESAVVVSGVALIAKSPTVFVVGGLAIVIEAWRSHWQNHYNPATGSVVSA